MQACIPEGGRAYNGGMPDSAGPPSPQDQTLQTEEPDHGRSVFEQLYQPRRIDIQPGAERRFAWNWSISPRGAVVIIRGHAHSGSVTLAGVSPYLVLSLVTSGSLELSSAGQQVEILPGRSAGLVNADLESSMLNANGALCRPTAKGNPHGNPRKQLQGLG